MFVKTTVDDRLWRFMAFVIVMCKEESRFGWEKRRFIYRPMPALVDFTLEDDECVNLHLHQAASLFSSSLPRQSPPSPLDLVNSTYSYPHRSD